MAGIAVTDPRAASRRQSGGPARATPKELLKQAVAAHRNGHHDAAERLYREAIARDPGNAIARNDLGILLLQRGQPQRGEELIREAISLKSDYAEAHCNLGTLLREKGAAEEAITEFEAAVAAKPSYAEAHYSLGAALARKGNSDGALAAFENAIASRPGYVEAQFGRANALKVKGRLADAIAAYRDVVAMKPELAAGHARLGLALWEANESDEAIAAYRRALSFDPQNREALSNLALALVEIGEIDAAIAEYREGLAFAPDWAHAHFGLALALLLRGDHAEGWREYEWRWKGAIAEIKPREMAKPQWQGEDLSGRTLYVHGEQGLGDILQFARFLPRLAARGAEVILEVPAKLVALLRLARVAASVVAAGTQLPEFDFHLPLLSLPSVIGLSEAAIPAEIPYLVADPARVAGWRERLPRDGFRVGIAWQGNPNAPIDKGRSIPLSAFAPLAAVPGVRLISLQKNFGLDQLDLLPEGMPVETLGSEFDAGPDAFLDAAAVMVDLDLVVTSDTSLAHLAGALGRPVWIVLKSNPDWRWLLGREDSPWYPTARLFRQRERGDWGEALQRVARELAAVVSGNAGKLFAGDKAEPPDMRRARAAAAFDGGFERQRSDRLDEAAALYARAITLDPDHAEAYSNLGVIRHGAGLLKEAIALYCRAVAIKPSHAPAWGNLAVAFAATGDTERAIAAFRQAVATKPGDAEGHLKLGDLLRGKGDIDGAIAAYRQAAALLPDDPKAHFRLGFGLQKKGVLNLSIEAYRQAIALAPELAQAHANLGVALLDAEHIADGIAACRRAIELAPDNPQFQANLGLALGKAGKIDAGIAHFERAIAIDPRYAEGHANLALVLLEQGKMAGAIEHGREAVALKPDYAEAHFNLSLMLLLSGDLAAGWPEYEWRWKGGIKQLEPRKFKAPPWQGEDLAGKTVLLHAEQGLGDTLQFARFAAVLAQRGARVVLLAQRELAALLRTTRGLTAVVVSGERLPHFDFHLPLLSVPSVLGTTEETIPADVPYLAADAERVAQWRVRLPRDGFKIGIVWQGRRDVMVDKGRSIPLSAFSTLAAVPGVHLVSLQKSDGLDQSASMPEGMRLTTLGPGLDAGPDAFLDTGAVMMSLDLVVTCDTSAAHLAGALGRPVWVALKHVPDWRWQLERADSPWYPSARLFRQRTPGDWEELFSRIAAALAETVSGNAEKLVPPGRSGDHLDRARAAFDRGFALHRDGRIEDAVAAYSEAIALDFGHAEASANLGVISHAGGDIDKAIALYRRAVAIKPHHAGAWGNLAVALTSKGDLDGAVAAARQAIAAKPEDIEGQRRLGDLLLRKRDAAGAADAYRQAIGLSADDAAAHFGLAVALFENGDVAAAWRECEWAWRGEAKQRIPVIFTWPIFDRSGWGIYGLNLALGWADDADLLPVCGGGIASDLAIDPLRRRRLDATAARSRFLSAALRHFRGRAARAPIAALQAIGKGLAANKAAHNVALRGTIDIGVLFVEDTRIEEQERERAKRYSLLVAGSSWNKRLLEDKGVATPLELVHQGIDLALFHPGPRNAVFGDRFVVFSGGKLEYRKGQDLVLLAFRAFHARHPEALLVTAWHSPWTQLARSLAADPSLAPVPIANGRADPTGWAAANGIPAGNFLDLGAVPNSQMPQVLRECDVALFPNRAEGGTNLVAMECMACGVPCIISANTGHLDIIQPGACLPLTRQERVFADPQMGGTEEWGESDVEEAVEALEAVWQDRRRAQQIGRAAAALMTEFGWARQLSELKRVLLPYLG